MKKVIMEKIMQWHKPFKNDEIYFFGYYEGGYIVEFSAMIELQQDGNWHWWVNGPLPWNGIMLNKEETQIKVEKIIENENSIREKLGYDRYLKYVNEIRDIINRL